jgi:predicted Zn-dependent protease
MKAWIGALFLLASLRASAGATLGLVAVGELKPALLSALAGRLQSELGIPSTVLALKVEPGNYARDARSRWLADTKRQTRGDKVLLKAMRKEAARRGIGESEMWSDGNYYDLLLFALADDADDLKELKETSRQMLDKERQWDAKQLLARLQKAAARARKPGQAILGVTALDLSSPQNNYQYGEAAPGTALISAARFSPELSRETPDEAKLVLRLEKQALAGLAEAWELPDCGDKACARARVNSLPDFDAKHAALCARCLKALKGKP